MNGDDAWSAGTRYWKAGLAPNATVMSWRGSDGGIAAANAGHDVVMTPTTYCYLDYYQHEDWTREPPAISARLTLDQVWQFVVVPEKIAPDKRHHILGGQGNIWTEYIPRAEQWNIWLIRAPSPSPTSCGTIRKSEVTRL